MAQLITPQVGDLVVGSGIASLVRPATATEACEGCGGNATFVLTPVQEMADVANPLDWYATGYCLDCLTEAVNSFDAVDALYRAVSAPLPSK